MLCELLLMVLAGGGGQVQAGAEWNYHRNPADSEGTAHWAEKDSDCAGSHQSPISIMSQRVVHAETASPLRQPSQYSSRILAVVAWDLFID